MPRVPFELIRETYKRCCEGSNPQPSRIALLLAQQVGFVDGRGQTVTRADGSPGLAADRKHSPTDANLLDVTEAICGPEWPKVLGLARPGENFPFRHLLREEAAAPIGPSHLANFNAWTATAGALLDSQMLQGYETPDFSAANGGFKDFFPIRQAVFWNGGLRLPAIIGPSEMAPLVGPGESHPDVRVDGMWVETQGPKKYGQKATITKEAAFVDITRGEATQRALDVGFGIAYREHDLSLNAILGIDNNFKLGLTADASATGYNTYGATVPTGLGTTGTLGNSFVNPMTDPLTSIQASDTPLTGYVHPVTGLPMPLAADLNTVLIPTTLRMYAAFLSGATTLTVGTIAGSPVPAIGGGTYPTSTMTGPNPMAGRFGDVRVSQWLYTKLTAATTSARPTIPVGKGLSTTNANRWYRINPAKFACRLQAWELQSIDLAPNSYVMADQGIVAGRVANIATTVQVVNPWMVQENKVA